MQSRAETATSTFTILGRTVLPAQGLAMALSMTRNVRDVHASWPFPRVVLLHCGVGLEALPPLQVLMLALHQKQAALLCLWAWLVR